MNRDGFLGELLEWGRDHCSFRLLTGRTIQVPTGAIAVISNPPGEVDLIDQSFDENSMRRDDEAKGDRYDIQSKDGRSILQLSGDARFEEAFPLALTSARIEVSFQVIALDQSARSGEWTLAWASGAQSDPSVTIRVGPHRLIQVTQLVPSRPASVQSFTLAEGWHSFIAIVTPERTRLIVDDANLAVFAIPDHALKSIHFRAAGNASKNRLQLDSLRVRRLDPPDDQMFARDESLTLDMIAFSTGDQLLGRVSNLDRHRVRVDAFDEPQSIRWTRIAGVCFAQSSSPVQQSGRVPTGIVAEVEMQPLTDRPDCPPERWTGTIIQVDENEIVLHHPLIGPIPLSWNEIRRIDPQFVGRSLLVDGRRFHLGNAIRSDFHRQQPDGTDCLLEIALDEIPTGKCDLTVDVAELEAAGPDAPPASPFLADLRAGDLTTEIFVNDQSVGNLNSRIRFKATAQNPDRIQLAIPPSLLKIGRNSIRLKQHSKKDAPREFDDCEIGNVRLEFGVAEAR